MAASAYLAKRSEDGEDPLRSSIYTGLAYMITVIFLVLPFFIFASYLPALASSIVIALAIIAAFNFYVSVAKGYGFKRRFLEMALISLGVSAISLGIGILVKTYLGISV